MSFLTNLFEKIKGFQKTEKMNQTNVKQVYPGYKTIAIQELKERPIKKLESRNGKGIWENRITTKKLFCYEENNYLTQEAENGFFETFFQAYMNHGDVKFSPDDVWMTIMLYFSKYVNDHAQQLRKAFVKHEGKKQLTIETFGETENQWSSFFDKILVAIRKNTDQKATNDFQCNFTTTGKFQTLFSTALIMNTYKKYFDYSRMMCVCGIVNVHMSGVLEDWEKLLEKLKNLMRFDVNGELKRYVKGLEPVLEQFIETYKGDARIQFWNNIYQERKNPESFPYAPKQFLDGWLIKFFTSSERVSGVNLEEFDVSIRLINMGNQTSQMVNLVGGCKGYSVQDRVYSPHFSFAVVQKHAKMQTKMTYEDDND